MSLEQSIDALKAAVEALTAKIDGAAVKTAKADTETTAKPGKTAKPETTTKPGKAAKPGITREQMQAALADLKAKDGDDAKRAKAIITSEGGVGKMAEIPEDCIEAVYNAATALLNEEVDDTM